MLHLTIWMNMPSFHQEGLFKALDESKELDLRIVFAGEGSADRLILGWIPPARDYPHRFLSKQFTILDAVRVAWRERKRLHIVNGIWAEPSFAAALCVLALAGGRFIVYAEAPDPRKKTSLLRRTVRRLFGGWLARRAFGMLPVSSLGEQFYTQLGFDPSRTYLFGYFLEKSESPNFDQSAAASLKATEVVFVGQLIYRKGVDLLIEALKPLISRYPDLFLTVIGSGNETNSLREQSRMLQISDRVAFEGTVSSDLIQSRIKTAAVLVLPSRWDGWGVVVNEALSVGVPVIVSDQCGAADLVSKGINGYVFTSGDMKGLRACLSTFLDLRTEWPRLRGAALETGENVSAESAAAYLIDCLKHMTGYSKIKPTPPWWPAEQIQQPSVVA